MVAQENTSEESGDIRRKAFVRLGIAAVVTALALAALWWLDHSSKTAVKPKPTAPAPIVAAPVQVPTPEPQPAEEPKPTPAPEIPQPTPPEETAPPPPPPVVGAPAGQRAPAAPQAAHRAARKAEPAPPAATAKPAPTPIAPAAPFQTTPGGHYVVQVGVFSDPDHAQKLVDQLSKEGVHAYVETRVHVGPFASQTEADRAQAALKKMGITGMVARAAATK